MVSLTWDERPLGCGVASVKRSPPALAPVRGADDKSLADQGGCMTVDRMTARLSGGELAYWSFGDGRPLLYLHSAGGPQVTPFLEGLARTHRIVMPIAPGFEG